MTKRLFLVALLIASTCTAQEPAPNPQQSIPSAQTAAPADSLNQMIVIPAGTRIPLTLSSPIAAKSAQPGYTVRAATAFPVTVGTQMAIPVGSYVEGVIDKVTKGGHSGSTLQIRFTRLIFSNGYSVRIDGANLQARTGRPEPNSPETAPYSMSGFGMGEPRFLLAALQAPNLPTLPHVGPPVALVVGLAVGIPVIVIIGVIFFGHHHGVSGVLYDTGWQFDMVLNSPVSIDAASIATAIAPSNAQ